VKLYLFQDFIDQFEPMLGGYNFFSISISFDNLPICYPLVIIKFFKNSLVISCKDIKIKNIIKIKGQISI
jgi:hypothetical protein